MFPGLGVGIGVRPAWGAAPLQGLLLSCALSWVYALEGQGNRGRSGVAPPMEVYSSRELSLALLMDLPSPGCLLG